MLNFKEAAQSGGFFKPADYKDAEGFLIEVKGIDKQRPTPYGPKDSVRGVVTVFKDKAAVNAGEPSEVHENMRIESTVLTRDLADNVGIGNATIVKLAQTTPSKPGQHPAWVWRQPEADVRKAIIDYATKREEQRAAALAAAPDFD